MTHEKLWVGRPFFAGIERVPEFFGGGLIFHDPVSLGKLHIVVV